MGSRDYGVVELPNYGDYNDSQYIFPVVLLVSIFLVVLYVKVQSCIVIYCSLSLYCDISHAPFHCVILVEPCGSFFLFASFQV